MNNNKLIEPPDYIDGAKLIKWAWSGQEPFYRIYSEDRTEFEEIYGLAICQYEKSNSVYHFSCDQEWETIQDAPYNNVDKAVHSLPNQYRNKETIWHDK